MKRWPIVTKAAPHAVPLWPFVLFFAVFIDKIHFFFAKMALITAMGYSPAAVIGSAVVQDCGLLALLFFLSLFASGRMRVVSVPLMVLLNVLYLADSQLFQALYQRLTYLSVYRFMREWSAIASFVTVGKIAAVVGITGLLVFIRHFGLNLRRGRNVAAFTMAIVGVVPLVNWSGRPFDSTFENVTANVLLINERVVLARNFDGRVEERTRRLFPGVSARIDAIENGGQALPPEARDAAASVGKRPNVILFISESLSQVDSLRSGGIFDRLPGIGRVQSEGLTLRNVIADGSNTSDGLASLLTGVEPLPTSELSEDMGKRFPILDGRGASLFTGRKDTDACGGNVVCYAKKAGYHTVFLTTGPLGFLGHGGWLHSLGFDRIEGGDSPFYEGAARFSFGAPSDEMLYRRAEEVIRGEPRPFFLVLLTVSLHSPLMLPDPKDSVGSDPLVNVLTYVDRTTTDFYGTLKKDGVLRDSVVLLVGDHRRMTPLDREEFAKRGIDSNGRVVAAFLGAGVPVGAFDDTLLNQSDLSRVLRGLLDGDRVFERGLAAYNKGSLLGFGRPFAVQVVSDDYSRVLVREEGEKPWLVTMRQDMDPVSLRKDGEDRRIMAYLLLSAARNEAWQRDAGLAGH